MKEPRHAAKRSPLVEKQNNFNFKTKKKKKKNFAEIQKMRDEGVLAKFDIAFSKKKKKEKKKKIIFPSKDVLIRSLTKKFE